MYNIANILTRLFNEISLSEAGNTVNIPYKDREIMEIANDDLIFRDDAPEWGDSRVINFQHIITTGDIDQGIMPVADHTIDWETDDTFNDTMNSLEKNVLERIESHDDLQSLLTNDPWTLEDRVQWEYYLSGIVSDELNKIPGLDEYRTQSAFPWFNSPSRDSDANELSDDIENDTENMEFDCELMSIIEGSILQRVENSLLPKPDETQDEFKRIGNYFYAQSQLSSADDNPYESRAHAFIISSLTGNIIEATADPDAAIPRHPMTTNIDPNFTFDQFIETGVAITSRGIYHSESVSLNDALDLMPESVFDAQKVGDLYDGIIERYTDTKLEDIDFSSLPPYLPFLISNIQEGKKFSDRNIQETLESIEEALIKLEETSRQNITQYIKDNPSQFQYMSEEQINNLIKEQVKQTLDIERDIFMGDMPDRETIESELREEFIDFVRGMYDRGDGAWIDMTIDYMATLPQDSEQLTVNEVTSDSIVRMGNVINTENTQQAVQRPIVNITPETV